jgi:hypothetical protein
MVSHAGVLMSTEFEPRVAVDPEWSADGLLPENRLKESEAWSAPLPDWMLDAMGGGEERRLAYWAKQNPHWYKRHRGQLFYIGPES